MRHSKTTVRDPMINERLESSLTTTTTMERRRDGWVGL
jgi:hypothetical protein